jgi:hypothetical protein
MSFLSASKKGPGRTAPALAFFQAARKATNPARTRRRVSTPTLPASASAPKRIKNGLPRFTGEQFAPCITLTEPKINFLATPAPRLVEVHYRCRPDSSGEIPRNERADRDAENFRELRPIQQSGRRLHFGNLRGGANGIANSANSGDVWKVNQTHGFPFRI